MNPSVIVHRSGRFPSQSDVANTTSAKGPTFPCQPISEIVHCTDPWAWPGAARLRGGINSVRSRQQAPYVLWRRQKHSAKGKRSDHSVRIGRNHPFPHIRVIRIPRTMMSDLQDDRLPLLAAFRSSRQPSSRARDSDPPKVCAQEDSVISHCHPQCHRNLIGLQAHRPALGLTLGGSDEKASNFMPREHHRTIGWTERIDVRSQPGFWPATVYDRIGLRKYWSDCSFRTPGGRLSRSVSRIEANSATPTRDR